MRARFTLVYGVGDPEPIAPIELRVSVDVDGRLVVENSRGDLLAMFVRVIHGDPRRANIVIPGSACADGSSRLVEIAPELLQ